MRKVWNTIFCCLILTPYVMGQSTVAFYLNQIENSDLVGKANTLKSLIEKETNLKIELKFLKTHEELVLRFGDERPCFGLMNSYGYVMANKKYGAKARLRVIRYGIGLYYGMIVVRRSSGIKSITDLNGRIVAFTDELSTSGYLYPKKLLAKRKVKPRSTLFLNSHQEVISQVYSGIVDAGAAYYSPESKTGELRDARASLQKQFPDVGKELIVLAKTDPIPNEPLVFSRSLPPDISLKITLALVRIATSDLGKNILKSMFNADGLVRTTDGEYNSLREVIEDR